MRRVSWFALLLLTITASATEHPCRGPVWTVDIAVKYGFRPFGVLKHPRNSPPFQWRTAQGVVFTSPETLAIYQVLERDNLPPLEPRDMSGGGGRYTLRIVFLDRASGTELHQLNLTTESSAISGVYPTHDGKFLVLTGQLLRLYSPAFQEIASRPGPIGQSGKRDDWHVSVMPSGQRIFAYAGLHIDMPFLLDADTLDTIPNPTPSDVALWREGYRIFPELRGERMGIFSTEGQRLTLDYSSKINSCTFVFFLVPAHQVERGGHCKMLRVFSSQGRMVWDVPLRGDVAGFSGGGPLLAAVFYRYHADPFDLGTQPTPLRITVYDLNKKAEKCSIHLTEQVFGWWESRYFDLSSSGSLAVAQQSLLSLYEP